MLTMVSFETMRGGEVQIPEGTDVLVLPGVPGSIERFDDGRGAYPATTADVVKLLRAEGLNTDYAESRADRADYTLKAADMWLPILAFTADALSNGAGDLFAGAVRSLLGHRGSKSAVIHLRVGKAAGHSVDWFEADGPAEGVLESFKLWVKSEDD
jgi:hypothetical protein